MKIGPSAHSKGGDLRWSFYPETGETALVSYSPDGEPELTITVNPEEPARRSGECEIWVRLWSPNEGVVQALLDAGIATDTPEMARCGYSAAVLCKLTPAAIHDRATSLPPDIKAAQDQARINYAKRNA